MALSGKHLTIVDGDQRATIAEVGASLAAYSAGTRVICPDYPDDELPPKGSGAILVPWPNRVAGGRYIFDGVAQQLPLTEPDKRNAIHGFGRWDRWSVIADDSSSVTLGLDIVPQKGYPFEIRAGVTYALGAHGLTVTMTARNIGTTAAPFGAGAHPYLTTGGIPLDDVELTVPADARIVVDDAAIPIGVAPADGDDALDGRPLGARRFDTGFGAVRFVDDRAVAVMTVGEATTELWWDAAFPFTQIFTVDDLGGSGPAVAIEPMSCPANAFNSGEALVVLNPGDRWQGTWGIRPTELT